MFAAFAAADPEPRTELLYETDFQLLVAVVLSAQAKDRRVNAATRGLFAAAPTPAAMEALGEAGIVEHIRTIGLFRTKARNVLGLCQQLRERHGGEVPRTRAELEALPGVGRKTAGVVLNIAFGAASIAVDTHVYRVAKRTGLAPERTVRAVEKSLQASVPQAYRRHAHHWLVLHGRYVCKERRPECWRCLIARYCEFEAKMPAPGRAGTSANAAPMARVAGAIARPRKPDPR